MYTASGCGIVLNDTDPSFFSDFFIFLFFNFSNKGAAFQAGRIQPMSTATPIHAGHYSPCYIFPAVATLFFLADRTSAQCPIHLNRLAQERIKMEYVKIMEEQKSLSRDSEEYRRLDEKFYAFVKIEDRLRRDMTLLVARRWPRSKSYYSHY